MTCASFCQNESVAEYGGACGIPTCQECLWYEECQRGHPDPAVQEILDRAEQEEKEMQR